MITPFRTLLGLILVSILLTGCGFHLRASQPLKITPLYLEANQNQMFARLLKRALQDHKEVQLVDDPKAAQYRLRLISEGLVRSVQGLSSGGRVRDVLLRDQISFEVKTADGQALLPPTSISVERVVSYDDRYALAKVNDEALTYREMQEDGVNLLMLRLNALNPDALQREQK